MNIQERLRHAAQWGVTEADGRPRADVMIEAADYIDHLEQQAVTVHNPMTEQELLVANKLLESLGDVVTSEALMKAARSGSRNSLKVVMHRVRSKLGGKARIETVRGVGYRMLR